LDPDPAKTKIALYRGRLWPAGATVPSYRGWPGLTGRGLIRLRAWLNVVWQGRPAGSWQRAGCGGGRRGSGPGRDRAARL